MTGVTIRHGAPGDAAAIVSLLEGCNLPTAGLTDHLAEAFVAQRDGRVVGSVALERYQDGVLLRSLAIDARERGSGLGRRLTETAITRAEALGVPAIYLLTTTAERFFPRFGFEAIDRIAVPASVQESVEFTSACPASAIVMRKRL